MSDGPSGQPKVIQLCKRDIEDATRLLSLLAGARGKIMIGPDIAEASKHPHFDRDSQQRALQMLADRRRRHEVFGKSMFGEPAWEILLFLYALGPKQTITKLADLAGASKSTTLRWIDYLESHSWITRVTHPNDKRAIIVELTEKAIAAIQVYISGTVRSED